MKFMSQLIKAISQLVLHSDINGVFESVKIDEGFRRDHVIEEEVRVNVGDEVSAFSGANAAIGTLFLKFSTREELNDYLQSQKNWIKINIS